MHKLQSHFTTVILLGLLASLTPLSIDMYLPSMPDISKDLSVGIEKVELTKG